VFKNKEKADLDAALQAAAKPATGLVVAEQMPADHAFPPTATHFGGHPYFEAGETWPVHPDNQRPYDFVCQINLRDCPVRPDVPFDLFTVFLCWICVEDEDQLDMEGACLVRTYRDASPARAVTVPRPDAAEPDDYRVMPCTIETETFDTYPTMLEGFPDLAAAAARVGDAQAAFESALKRLGFWNECRSRVGGYPTWVHDDTFRGEDGLIFLAQIDHEPDANNCIQDAAPIYIAVSTAEPPRVVTDVFQSH
jgi:uncharacterized protein YwqG